MNLEPTCQSRHVRLLVKSRDYDTSRCQLDANLSVRPHGHETHGIDMGTGFGGFGTLELEHGEEYRKGKDS